MQPTYSLNWESIGKLFSPPKHPPLYTLASKPMPFSLAKLLPLQLHLYFCFQTGVPSFPQLSYASQLPVYLISLVSQLPLASTSALMTSLHFSLILQRIHCQPPICMQLSNATTSLPFTIQRALFWQVPLSNSLHPTSAFNRFIAVLLLDFFLLHHYSHLALSLQLTTWG